MSESAAVSSAGPPAVSRREIVSISVDLIDEPFLPQRAKFADEPFAQLVESIAANGVQVPLLVRPVGERYQIIAGHRRFTAAKVAGLHALPCMIEECTDLEALRRMIAENTGREEPSDAEQGRHYLEICERFSLSEYDVAKMVGKSERYVTERCDMVRRFPELADANENGAITWIVADQLSRVNDYTYARELRIDVQTMTDEQREKVQKHRLMLLDLCVQQGANGRLARSYVEQWKRSIIPFNSYDPGLAMPASAPQAAAPANKCACCGSSEDQLALVPLWVHSWEKNAVKSALRERGMFGGE